MLLNKSQYWGFGSGSGSVRIHIKLPDPKYTNSAPYTTLHFIYKYKKKFPPKLKKVKTLVEQD